jgi:hypothetical protein
VTAVDYSKVALGILRERSAGMSSVHIVHADLEANEFSIEALSFDLICDCCFLWRPLFRSMQAGICSGGFFVGVYPLAGDEAAPRPTSGAFLIEPAELLGFFAGWEICHYFEGRPGRKASRRLRAEIVARKPTALA